MSRRAAESEQMIELTKTLNDKMSSKKKLILAVIMREFAII